MVTRESVLLECCASILNCWSLLICSVSSSFASSMASVFLAVALVKIVTFASVRSVFVEVSSRRSSTSVRRISSDWRRGSRLVAGFGVAGDAGRFSVRKSSSKTDVVCEVGIGRVNWSSIVGNAPELDAVVLMNSSWKA